MSACDTPLAVWHILPPGARSPDAASAALLAMLLGQGHSVLFLPADAALDPRPSRHQPDLIHALSASAAEALAPLAGRERRPAIVVECQAGCEIADGLAALLRSGGIDRIVAPDAPTRQRFILEGRIDPMRVVVTSGNPAATIALYREVLAGHPLGHSTVDPAQAGPQASPPPPSH